MKIEKSIKEFGSGNLDNFGEIYEEFANKIYNFIYYKVENKELAEDLTSEVFFKIIKNYLQFKGSTIQDFSRWIYKIAYNGIIDNYRTQKENICLDEVENIKGYERDFGKSIDNKSTLEDVMNYLEKIDKDQKNIFIMRIRDDLSYKEIAEITGKSIDNCKKIVSRIIVQLEANVNYMLIFILIIEIIGTQK